MPRRRYTAWRKKATGARRRPALRRRRGVSNQAIHYFKRSDYISGFAVASSTADQFGALVFSIAQLHDVSDFTNLFDQYQIRKVRVSIIPRANSSDAGTGTTTGQSMGVFSCIDYDDNTALTSLDEIMDYQNVKMTRSTQQHVRTFVPRLRNAVVGSLGVIAYGNNRNTWIDTNATTVPYFGMKTCFQQLPNGTQIYDLKVDYWLAFRNVR